MNHKSLSTALVFCISYSYYYTRSISRKESIPHIPEVFLRHTQCTLEARPLTQGKPGFPAYATLNISLGTSFVQ